MRTIRVIVFVALILSLSSKLTAQFDCRYSIEISVRDENQKSVVKAKVKLFERTRKLPYDEAREVYTDFGLLGVGAPAKKTIMKVSAKGFETFRREISVSCAGQSFVLLLKRKGSSVAASFEDKIIIE